MIFALATAAFAAESPNILPWAGTGLQLVDNDDNADHSGDGDPWNTWIHGYMEGYIQKSKESFVENFEKPENNNSLNTADIPHVNITIPPCQIGKKKFDTLLVFIIVTLVLQVLLIGVFILAIYLSYGEDVRRVQEHDAICTTLNAILDHTCGRDEVDMSPFTRQEAL